MTYRLLDAFRAIFEGKQYRHRASNQGDRVARYLYEDLYTLGTSKLLRDRIDARELVVNVQNIRRGIRARRGDGTLGALVPGVVAVVEPDFRVARGPVASVSIGVEVKILAKAMIKQIDRVKGDLRKQVPEFRQGDERAVCVAVVGINHARYAVGYEGDRRYPTDGKGHRHPIQEATEAEKRLRNDVAPEFDELVCLRYEATNDEPYPFTWVNYDETCQDYGAALIRLAGYYDQRYGG